MKTPKIDSIKNRMPGSTKGKLAVATGVAAAAAVGYVATRAVRKGSEKAYRVAANDEGWVLNCDGEGDGAHFETKSEAVEAARELARANGPSHLIIENADGEIVRGHSYRAAD